MGKLTEKELEYARRYRAKHPDRVKAAKAKCNKKNRAKYAVYERAYRAANIELYRECDRKRRRLHPERERERDRKKMANRRLRNPSYRILENLRGRINSSLRRKACRSARTLELLGCDIPSFRIYLESKFEPGMTWENYGKGGWEIDHIMPCAIFDLTKPEHQNRCFHFSNMQPMWAHANKKKGASVSSWQ